MLREEVAVKKMYKKLVQKLVLCYYYIIDGLTHHEFKERRLKPMAGNDMLGKVDSVDFAVYLNKKAKEQGKNVNVTKIQKWLYICYGLYLAVRDEQLLDERPQAWKYGPFFPQVHDAQKSNGDSLDNLLGGIDEAKFAEYDGVINATLKNFGDWSASQLVNWTHQKDSAWYIKKESGEMFKSMDNHDIRRDFKRLFTNG